ncbi:GTP-binding protein [Candidatus Woesearchaeota archaeon]|nr:GTP-binding protein [Candidatus Woesearchaeota archaeon]
MVDYHKQIEELEAEMRKTQYNKATEHHFGVIKARIAKLREAIEKKQASKKAGEGFSVKKSGNATVVLLGFPSVGKSTLLNKITGANSEVGAYEFTTLTVIPGVLEYNHAKIQILDVPGILEGASKGRGRGKEVLSMIRAADLVLILIDALHPEHYSVVLKEIAATGIRINQQPPDIKIIKKARGGINIGSTVKLSLNKETIEGILKEFKLNNADIIIRQNATIDQLIDAVEKNKSYLPAVSIITKADLVNEDQLNKLIEKIKPDLVISAQKEKNIEELKKIIYQKLRFIRIYLKEIGKKADLEEPLIVRKGATIEAICKNIHRDLIKRFKYARIWGFSVKFPGQIVKNLNKELDDKDIIEIHTT